MKESEVNGHYIYHEIAKAIDALLTIDKPHAYSSHVVLTFPASFVRIWYNDMEGRNEQYWLPDLTKPEDNHSPFGNNIQTTILFIEDLIQTTHFAAGEVLPRRFDIELADPNCFEILLCWMKENSLTLPSTVFVKELAI